MELFQEEEACLQAENCTQEETVTPVEKSEFEYLGLKKEILASLKKAGFKEPSPIQRDVIPLILSGADVIGQAQTGTGKTAAFGLPALHKIENTGQVEVLVITPTRELTSQVSEELQRLGGALRVKIATVYGGKSTQNQIDAIRRGAQLVVATPGRLLDLLQSGKVPALKPSLVVVDEADEMLDMGFLEDIQAIFEFLPEERQTLLFSATMPAPIQMLAKKILKDPIVIKATQTQTSNENISQYYCIVQDAERDEAVIRLFEAQDMSKAILFCKTKKEVDRLSQVLNQRGHAASALHGDMEQNQRESVIHNFRSGVSRALVATDVAARGLNILDVTHVINFHIPFDADNYVHRIGRTGRAGRTGISLTLTTPKELGKLFHFQQKAGGKLERRYIPSKQEIRASQVRRLVHQIAEQVPAHEIPQIIESVSDNMDVTTLAGKLLGWILSQNPINGPDMIGVQGDVDSRKSSQRPSYPRRDREGHRRTSYEGDRGNYRRESQGGERSSYRSASPSGDRGGFKGHSKDSERSSYRSAAPSHDRGSYKQPSFRDGERNERSSYRSAAPSGDRGGFKGPSFRDGERNERSSYRSAAPSHDRGGYKGASSGEDRGYKGKNDQDFGSFPRKKFIHPASDVKKPKKRY